MTLITLRCQFPRQYSLWRKPLALPTRQFSQSTSRAFLLRPSRHLRQEATSPSPSVAEKVGSSTWRDSTFYEKIGRPGIRKQIIFATLTSFLAFTYAATQTTIETDHWTERMLASSPVWNVKTITNTDLKRAQNAELIQGLRETLANIQSTVQQLPVLIRPWINMACVTVMQPYADASEGKRLCWKICLLNVAVYAAWKVKRWNGFMTKRFMHYPLSGLSYTLITSVFSHRTALHLLCNCLALESFGSAAYYYLLREQNKAEPELLESTTAYHFLAFYISAGVFSGLVSHVVSAKFRFPRIVAELAASTGRARKTETWAGAVAATSTSAAQTTAKRKTLDILPSLGASGAIYGAVTMTALAFPDSQVALFIPPSYPINIQYGVGGLMLLDVIGIMRGWRMFDHWAHLGGAAFGVAYYYYGPSYWRYLRESTTQLDKAESESS
ncbi:hypothetical protein GALMADRAFT_231645 [Galerina marginata CBS 339.88]|uniref:Peptidase S54 rhomboid domain-containing protein n=1 Tax=Galerina marginata (strain CBS 339.88) TaxID=685588 RepID=A0A067SAS4_GALM3|nr:hypothetical protein GALMADRAFT_231645 [Galerina marginata CBS 339.88]